MFGVKAGARRVRHAVRDAAIRRNLLPSIHAFGNPLKTHEFNQLVELSDLGPTDRVLDFGCGIGTQTWILGRKVQSIVGVDISEPAVAEARQGAAVFGEHANAEFMVGDLLRLGLEPDFTKVLSFCVIEHVANAEEVMREFHRLLKPGGELILSADSLARIDDEAFIARHREKHHVERYYTPDTLRELIEQAGFEIVELYSILNSDYAHELMMSEREVPFGIFTSMSLAAKLERLEAQAPREDGLFLVAKARKASR